MHICEIFAFKLYCDLETRVESTYDFVFVFYSKYVSICYRFRDIAAYWSKIATPLYLAPPLGVKPSEAVRSLGHEKLE